MILIDLSQVAYALAYYLPQPLAERDFRQAILLKIAQVRGRLMKDYGKTTILCCDGATPYWRHDVFPLYKMGRHRQKGREHREAASRLLKQFIPEFAEAFPFRTICIPHIEADDIIATVAISAVHPTVIVSRDTDFVQLESNRHVRRFHPFDLYMYERSESPEDELLTKVIRGDTTDCIPNVLSEDHVFVSQGTRQKTMTAKRFETIRDTLVASGWEALPRELHRQYQRNEALISADRIPEWVREAIRTEMNHLPPSGRAHKYCMKHRLTNVMTELTYLT
jgi:hypothetical protein